MITIRKILTPVDLSPACKAGVRCALELARAKGAEVVVYHVIPPAEAWLARHDEFSSLDDLVERTRNRIVEFLEDNFSDCLSQVTFRIAVEVGVPHKMIVTKAEEEKVDIIAMSTRGASGVSHLALGSVTEKVVGRAFCPVLTVKGEEDAERGKSTHT